MKTNEKVITIIVSHNYPEKNVLENRIIAERIGRVIESGLNSRYERVKDITVSDKY